MANTIRIGIIGCGDVARTRHIPAVINNKVACLAGLCDIDTKTVKSLSEQYGVPGYTDYRVMFVQEKPDAVIVSTPPWITPDITIEALKSGCHVLCEKPMATELEKANEVQKTEVETGRYVQLGFTYRHDPLLEKLRGYIKDGYLGSPLVFRMGIFDEIWDPVGNGEHYKRIINTMKHGSPSLHDGAHIADYLNFLVDSEADKVFTYGFKSREEFPCSNYDTTVISFKNGDMAKLEIAWMYPYLPFGEFEVLGSYGYASYDRINRKLKITSTLITEEISDTENWWELCFRLQLERFIYSIKNNTPPSPGTSEGLYSLSLCKKIEKSMLS